MVTHGHVLPYGYHTIMVTGTIRGNVVIYRHMLYMVTVTMYGNYYHIRHVTIYVTSSPTDSRLLVLISRGRER